jgi:hypothetical protein
LEDYDIKKILEAEGVESRWKDYVLSRGTNNFWNLFSSDKPSMDRIPLYWVKPFYINSRFNGAWSQMCEKFPNEIRIIITEARMPGSVPKNERDEILKKLALFLNEKGVLVTYLCR